MSKSLIVDVQHLSPTFSYGVTDLNQRSMDVAYDPSQFVDFLTPDILLTAPQEGSAAPQPFDGTYHPSTSYASSSRVDNEGFGMTSTIFTNPNYLSVSSEFSSF